MGEAQIELLKGTLNMLVLKVVARAASSTDIERLLPRPSGLALSRSHRLEDRGFLEAKWKQSETGREAKFYSLTKKGCRQMNEEPRNWERLCDAVALVLRTPEKDS